MGEKTKVAVLGGGMGALAAAFELTSRSDLRERFEVTIYHSGRLGDACSRHREGIERQGLPILFGCYENAFRLLRECYAELGRTPGQPLATVEDAFKPQHRFVVMEEASGSAIPWSIDFPNNDSKPGLGAQEFPSPLDYLQLLVRWLSALFNEHAATAGRQPDHAARCAAIDEHLREHAGSQRPLGSLVDQLRGIHRAPLDVAESTFLYLASLLLQEQLGDQPRRFLWLLRRFREWLLNTLEPCMPLGDEARRLFIMFDIGIAAAVGMVEDELILPPYNWHKVDEEDVRDWLRKHGASRLAVSSAQLRAVYDLGFAPEGQLAAGTALNGVLRTMFSYRGAFAYRMQASADEVVFAPLQQVLERRGVKLELVHRVEQLCLSDDRESIAAIAIEQTDGAQRRLERGRDFHEVVLGLPLSALPETCAELIAADTRFAEMVANVKTNDPPEDYVLSVPGSSRYRLRADGARFDNLVMAGDWLLTGLVAGNLEAATMGGMQASRALAGVPAEIVGDIAVPSTTWRPSPTIERRVNAALPPFIERGGDLVVGQPLAPASLKLYTFALGADLDKLRRLVDAQLNAPRKRANVRYLAAAPMVALMFTDCLRRQTRSQEQRDGGELAERNAGFWVPVLAGRQVGERFLPERLTWFVPYVFTDSTVAMSSGREIYGLPKSHGVVTMPTDATAPGLFTVDTLLMQRASSPLLKRLITVKQREPGPLHQPSGVWTRLHHGIRDLLGRVEDQFSDAQHSTERLSELILHHYLELKSGMVFLKQFRDAADPSRACYQTVVEAATALEEVRGGGWLPAHEITIEPADSHPLVEDLGLTGGTMAPRIAAWLDFDFVMRPGKTM